jgi:pimeloyl-ACP methyl ester carboxylesterase
VKRGYIQVPTVGLAYVEFGGEGPGLLLLHGLMGRATTWVETARWLTPHFRVVGLDQRGHGLSDKPDNAYTREDYVNDAIAIIEGLGLAPAVVIGHSMGALNTWVLADRRPDLVRRVVLEDMGADAANREKQAQWQEWFAGWPVPFSTMADVRSFFGSQNPSWADYFMEVVAEGPNGYRPLFSFEHMLQSVADWEDRSYWAELEAVQCPALVVKGAESELSRAEAQEMARRLPGGRYAEVAGAGHVVHYDQPAGWRAVVEPFVLECQSLA